MVQLIGVHGLILAGRPVASASWRTEPTSGRRCRSWLEELLAAALIALRGSLRLGAALLAASMVASFAFGYLLHFVFDTPDLHTNVVGDHSGIFFHSALNLAMVELVGFVCGLTVALRGRA